MPRFNVQQFAAELKRRHVTHVACAYAVVAFVIMQVATTFFPALKIPDSITTLIAVFIILCFPVAIVLAWMFDLTGTGIQRTSAAAPEGGELRLRNGIAFAAVVVLTLSVAGAFVVTRVSDAGRPVNAVAVLPFENWSGNKDDEYFSDGITDDVLTQLARVDGLKVISRTSVMQYKGAKKPVGQIANELRVGAVLEGSVQRSGSRVRIRAQLIDARSDRHLWADTYDRDISDIFKVQSEIAQDIAESLRARLTPEKRAQLERVGKQSADPRAYEEYLRALQAAALDRRETSNEHLISALAIDARYAPAYATLARNYYFQAFLGALPPAEAFARIKWAATRALQLDNELADAHATMALYLMHYDMNFAAAEKEFQRALTLAPGNAQVHHDYAHYLLAMGRTAESAAESVRAVELDPNNTMLQACAGWHRFADGYYAAAVDGARKALMMMPNMFWPEIILGWGQEQSQDMPAAIATLRKADEHSQHRGMATAALAYALARSGQKTEAAQLLKQMQNATGSYVSPYDVAVVYTGLGDEEQALAWLKRAAREHATFFVFIGWDPRFVDLRADPRYRALTQRVGLPVS